MFVSEDRPSHRTTDFFVNRTADTQSAALCYGRFLQADPLGYEDGMNMYGYVGGDPVNYTDPDGLKNFYIGGAMDSTSKLVQGVSDADPGSHQYYQWWQSAQLRSDLLASSALGESINIIGHSLGGAVAINSIIRTKINVDKLITIDPVGMVLSAPKKVKTWANVTANPSSWDQSDVVAFIGGKVSSGITGQANYSISSTLHHYDFSGMINQLTKIGPSVIFLGETSNPVGSMSSSNSTGCGGSDKCNVKKK